MITYLFPFSTSQVLVEFDGVDWRKREWISVYGKRFSAFLIESSIVWTNRRENNDAEEKESPWLALVSGKSCKIFVCLYTLYDALPRTSTHSFLNASQHHLLSISFIEEGQRITLKSILFAMKSISFQNISDLRLVEHFPPHTVVRSL